MFVARIYYVLQIMYYTIVIYKKEGNCMKNKNNSILLDPFVNFSETKALNYFST